MLVEKEAYPSSCETRRELARVVDHGVEVEELHHLQRAPDLFPPSASVRSIENVDQSPLESRDPHYASGVSSLDYSATQVRKVSHRSRDLDGNEFQVEEGEAPIPASSKVVEAAPKRVGPAVELQRRVVGNDGIIRQLGGHEVGIDRGVCGLQSAGHRGIEAAPHAQDPAGRNVFSQQVVTGMSAPLTAARMGLCKLGVSEDGVCFEEFDGPHDLLPSAYITTYGSCFCAPWQVRLV